MKAFLFSTTTGDRWELCYGSYLVIANSKEEAETIFVNPNKSIVSIEELDLSEKKVIEIQPSIVE